MENNIQEILHERNLTQEQVAKKAGMERAYFNMIVSGALKNPTLETVSMTARDMGLRVDDLV